MNGPIRIGGIASGLDTELLVRDMMRIERMKADKLYQSRQTLEWQREDYRNINSLMLSFKNLVFDMKLQGTYIKNSAILSNDSIAEVTAGVTALEGSYTLRVNALAKQALTQSAGGLSRGLTGDALGDTINISEDNNEFIINLGGVEKTITIDEGEYEIADLAAKLQDQIDAAFGRDWIKVETTEDGGLKFSPESIAADGEAEEYKPQIILKSGKENDALETLGFKDGDALKVNINASLRDTAAKFIKNPFEEGNGLIEFKINGHTFSYDFSEDGADKDKSLSDIIKDINKNKDAKANAYYDTMTDKIVIKSKDFGTGAKVSIENVTGNLFGAEGALQIGSANDGEAVTVYGENAQIELNGLLVQSSGNKFTLEGLNFNLKEVSGETVTINVSKDTQEAFDSIKNFVDEYNALIEEINGKLYEERFRSYAPLTSEQKETMSDKEIELWEEKARSGLLRNDAVLNFIATNMRTVLYQQVKGTGSAYNTLSSIGITTGDYKELGKLHLNETKLKKALEDDLDGVMNLFSQTSDTDDEKGIAVALYDAVNGGIDRLSEKAGSATSFILYDDSYIGKQIKDMDDRIDNMERYLISVEERYWRQFVAMEKALEQMNAQSMWLSQQLMSLGN